VFPSTGESGRDFLRRIKMFMIQKCPYGSLIKDVRNVLPENLVAGFFREPQTLEDQFPVSSKQDRVRPEDCRLRVHGDRLRCE